VTVTMVSFTHLVVALSAIATSLAAPKVGSNPIKRDLEKRAPDFELRNLNALSRRQNYNQDYTTGGDVVYTHTSNGFTVDFDAADDFVVGVGWNPGSAQ
jgi:endo-1,4-beta-xylanase